MAPNEYQDEHQKVTLESYNHNIDEYLEKVAADTSRTLAYWPGAQAFLDLLEPGQTIFELGSGSGRDANVIEQAGFRVNRSDAALGFVEHIRSEGHDVVVYNVLHAPLTQKQTAIFANAVLLHFDEAQIQDALTNIHSSLTPGGLLYLGMKLGTFEGWREKGLSGKRYFKFWQLPALERLIKTVGFQLLTSIVTPDQDFVGIICRRPAQN